MPCPNQGSGPHATLSLVVEGDAWHWLSEKALNFFGDSFPAATPSGRPHPTGPQPSRRQAPCWAPFGRGWQSEEDAKVWEEKRLLFLLGLYTNGPSQHVPRGPEGSLARPLPGETQALCLWP